MENIEITTPVESVELVETLVETTTELVDTTNEVSELIETPVVEAPKVKKQKMTEEERIEARNLSSRISKEKKRARLKGKEIDGPDAEWTVEQYKAYLATKEKPKKSDEERKASASISSKNSKDKKLALEKGREIDGPDAEWTVLDLKIYKSALILGKSLEEVKALMAKMRQVQAEITASKIAETETAETETVQELEEA